MSLAPFDHQPRTRLIYGTGTLARVGELAAEIGGTRVLMCERSGHRRPGYVVRAVSFLREAGLAFADPCVWRGA
jgi:alcohol dehydrogenase